MNFSVSASISDARAPKDRPAETKLHEQHSTRHSAMGPGMEFDCIRGLLEEWGDYAEGIGDDAAVLSVPPGMQLVVSTDATVEDVHFRRRWITAHDVGARAAAAAFSDLAAMGASASAMLVSLVVPTIWREHLREFASGLKTTVVSLNARIVGGNISRGAAFSCTLTVIGYASQTINRSGAQPGDILFVTGQLGGPAVALAAWERAEWPPDWAKQRFLHPVARIHEGAWLASQGAHAMIDISDGLAADARHLEAASSVLCVLVPELLPRFSAVTAQEALIAGEEYELLVAIPAAIARNVAERFRSHFDVPFTEIGHVARCEDFAPRVESGAGHDHFSEQ